MPKKPSVARSSAAEPDFVSRQVAEAKRYYLNLNPLDDCKLTVVCGGVERMRKDYVVARDRFPYYAVELVTEGNGRLELNDRESELVAGAVFAYGPRTKHRIANQPPKRMRKYYVDFFGREAEELLSESGLLGDAPLYATEPHRLIEVFERLDREARENSVFAVELCELTLRTLFLKIRQLCVGEPVANLRSYETYERVREHIDRHFLRLTEIEELAAECRLTPVHVSRLFKQYAGIGPYQALLRRKMNYAAELLSRERLRVKEVAERLGFRDQFQFSRAFKSVYGVSPKHLIESKI